MDTASSTKSPTTTGTTPPEPGKIIVPPMPQDHITGLESHVSGPGEASPMPAFDSSHVAPVPNPDASTPPVAESSQVPDPDLSKPADTVTTPVELSPVSAPSPTAASFGAYGAGVSQNSNNFLNTPGVAVASPSTPSFGIPEASQAQSSADNTGIPKFVIALALIVFAAVVIGGFAYGGYYLGSNNLLMPGGEQNSTEEGLTPPGETPTPTPTPTATPDPMAGWATYNDKAGRFSIKHSADWKILEEGETVGIVPAYIDFDETICNNDLQKIDKTKMCSVLIASQSTKSETEIAKLPVVTFGKNNFHYETIKDAKSATSGYYMAQGDGYLKFETTENIKVTSSKELYELVLSTISVAASDVKGLSTSSPTPTSKASPTVKPTATPKAR